MTTYFNGLAAALAMEVGVHSVWINCRSSARNVPRLSSRALEERPRRWSGAVITPAYGATDTEE